MMSVFSWLRARTTPKESKSKPEPWANLETTETSRPNVTTTESSPSETTTASPNNRRAGVIVDDLPEVTFAGFVRGKVGLIKRSWSEFYQPISTGDGKTCPKCGATCLNLSMNPCRCQQCGERFTL